MTLLDKLKSWLGLEGPNRQEEPARDVGVTVEREGTEPSTETEAAVKGTGEPEPEAESPGGTEPPADTEAEPTVESDAEAEGDVGDESEAEPEAEEESLDVTDIKGIGPAYADRLAEAGIDDVADLAAADAGTLAEETDVSETRIENWIEQAEVR